MSRDRITVRIRSSYAIGRTETFRENFAGGRDMIVEIEPGTTVDALLRRLPSIGPPEIWDDIMLTVFVNETLSGFDHVLEQDDVIDLHVPVSGG